MPVSPERENVGHLYFSAEKILLDNCFHLLRYILLKSALNPVSASQNTENRKLVK